MAKKAWTVGYQGLTPERLLAALVGSKVEVLVDIRERPLSRKPGFNKNVLGASAEAAGLSYVHIRELGAPPSVRDPYKETGDAAAFRRAYLAHLRGQRKSIDRLIGLIGAKRCALLCLESDEKECHRGILCEKLEAEGLTFVHLRPADPRKPARSSGAKLSDFH